MGEGNSRIANGNNEAQKEGGIMLKIANVVDQNVIQKDIAQQRQREKIDIMNRLGMVSGARYLKANISQYKEVSLKNIFSLIYPNAINGHVVNRVDGVFVYFSDDKYAAICRTIIDWAGDIPYAICLAMEKAKSIFEDMYIAADCETWNRNAAEHDPILLGRIGNHWYYIAAWDKEAKDKTIEEMES